MPSGRQRLPFFIFDPVRGVRQTEFRGPEQLAGDSSLELLAACDGEHFAGDEVGS
jgi:hypothetical protein